MKYKEEGRAGERNSWRVVRRCLLVDDEDWRLVVHLPVSALSPADNNVFVFEETRLGQTQDSLLCWMW